MGYIFLSISLLCGVTKGYCSKKTSGFLNGYRDAVFVSLIRMLLCIAIGFILIVSNRQLQQLKLNFTTVWICALSGITTSVFVICWMISVQKNAYMMVDIFLMLGTLIPLIACNVLYNENITMRQWFGTLMLFAAVLLMCSYSRSIKGNLSFKAIVILILCGLANGLTEFSQKLFIQELPDLPISVFNFYTYIFSSATLLVFYAILTLRSKPGTGNCIKLTSYIGYVVIMSVCLFCHSYFHTAAAGTLDSAQLYPVSHGCALILSTIMSAVCFKEKPSTKSVIGLLMTFAALLLMNM